MYLVIKSQITFTQHAANYAPQQALPFGAIYNDAIPTTFTIISPQ
jgi:hypothetical protein